MVIRVLFISLECADPLFSGNGTYSRSLINSLLHHTEVEVFVVSASPLSPKEYLFPSEWLSHPLFRHHVVTVTKEKWYRHDINSTWEEFAKGFDTSLLGTLQTFAPHIIIGVDWSALQPYQAVHASAALKDIPYLYLNFRVFHASSAISEHDKTMYKAKEYESCVSAVKTITLSPSDTTSLRTLTRSLPHVSSTISTLLPPLPRKIQSLATSYIPPNPSSSLRPPSYLLCCVRLSPEKNVEVFVSVCSRLSAFLTQHNIIPYLCGAAQSKDYADTLRGALSRAHPASVIVEEVLNHEALVEVYKQTILNFHPALYEAYGLTIVEAAAFGVPSIVNQGGDIGATALLQPTAKKGDTEDMQRDTNKNEGIDGAYEVFTTAMGEVERVARDVQTILSPSSAALRAAVASRARTKSLSYSEHENGEQFLQHLKEILHVANTK